MVWFAQLWTKPKREVKKRKFWDIDNDDVKLYGIYYDYHKYDVIFQLSRKVRSKWKASKSWSTQNHWREHLLPIEREIDNDVSADVIKNYVKYEESPPRCKNMNFLKYYHIVYRWKALFKLNRFMKRTLVLKPTGKAI